MAATFYLLYVLWQKGETKLIRNQASIILLTGIISFVPASLIDIVLPLSRIYFIPNIGPSFVLIFALGIIYAMTRFHFAISEEEIKVEVEKATQKEREFSDILVKTAQVIILVLDPMGRIVSFNPYMEKLSGYKLEEVKGKDWFSIFLKKYDYDKLRDLFKKAISSIETKGNVNVILAKDGREDLYRMV